MPLLKATIARAGDEHPSEAIAKTLTDLTQRHLHKDPALTAVIVTTIDRADWFIGGQSLAAHGMSSFALEISVTAGTNTKSEVAGYIAAVFAAMARLLGPLHDASYVIVSEVAAGAWGYAGQTQEFRFVAGRLQVSERS